MKFCLLLLIFLLPLDVLSAVRTAEQGDSTVLQLTHRKTKRAYTIEPGQKVRIRRKNGMKAVGYIDKVALQTIYLDNGSEIILSEIEEIFLPRVKNKWLSYVGWFSILVGSALTGYLVYAAQQLLRYSPMAIVVLATVGGLVGGPAITLILLGILPFVIKQRRFDLRKKYTVQFLPKKP